MLRKWLGRSASRDGPPDTPHKPEPDRRQHSADNVVPRPAPYTTDDAAISAFAAEIAAFEARVESAAGAMKAQFVAVSGEIAALGQNLSVARNETAATRKRLADVEKAAAEAEDWRTQLYKSERMLIDELDRVAARCIAAATPDPAADASAPEVSVVMPVWNRADLIPIAIRSILAQSFRNWELVIVDDGSTDPLEEALRPFRADPRIRVFHQANQGECKARNRGVGLTRGEIVAYLDSDNFWYPDFLDAAVRVFRADPELEIAYGGSAYDWPNGDVRFYLLPYSREALLRDNLADINVIVHRRRAYERYGPFDEQLARAIEWDMMLRYTVERPAAHIPVVAARYRIVDRNNRLSGRNSLYDNVFRVRRKWWERPAAPRILYAARSPALRTRAVATEAACMRRFGAVIEAWPPDVDDATANDIPLHAGTLTDAVRAFAPAVVHVHGIDLIGEHSADLAAAGVPLTLRADRSAPDGNALAAALKLPNLHRAYLAAGSAPGGDARIRFLAPYFDTAAFEPALRKDQRLIVAAAAGGSAGDLRAMLDLAARLPEHRIVVVVTRALDGESALAALEAYRAESGSPAELILEPPRAEMAALLANAGIVVHGAGALLGESQALALDAIVEALATGAHVLAPNLPVYERVVGNSGALYDSISAAAALIREREAWSDAEWNHARVLSIDRAYRFHADELVLRPVFEDWCALAREKAAPTLVAAAD